MGLAGERLRRQGPLPKIRSARSYFPDIILPHCPGSSSDPKISPVDGTLIFGGTGFLGAHVAAHCLAHSRRDATFARPLGSTVWAVGRDVSAVPRFGNPRDGVEFLVRDLKPEGAARVLLEELKPKRVLLLAALSRVRDCEEQLDLAERMNVDLPREVAEWCGQRGARLIHVSSDLVFGADSPPVGGFREEDMPAPVSRYGDTKARGEHGVLLAAPAALVVRLPLLYGDSGGRGLGASDSLLMAVDQGAVPPLFTDEYRTPLEVSQVAAALVELLGRNDKGLLHLAGPERLTRHDLGLIVLETHGLSPDEAAGSVRRALQGDLDTGGPRAGDTSLCGKRARGRLESPLDGPSEALVKAHRSA